jgi:molecular chaperone DnaK
VATGGLPTVAGDRFDEHIRLWATSRFIERSGLRPEAFNPSPGNVDLLIAESERAKISLSDRVAETVRLPRLVEISGKVYDLSEPFERRDFEALIRVDLEDALHEVHRMLDEARVSLDEVDRVLLIGGSSRIPILRAEMKRLFGMRATTVENSQTVIAEGAAAIAFFRYEPFLARPIKLRLATHTTMTIFDRDTIVPQSAQLEKRDAKNGMTR